MFRIEQDFDLTEIFLLLQSASILFLVKFRVLVVDSSLRPRLEPVSFF